MKLGKILSELKGLFILTCSISIVFAIVFIFIIPQYYIQVLPFVLLFFLLVNSIAHLVSTSPSTEKIARFSLVFMLSTTIKLIIYLIFIAVYILAIKEKPWVFIISFLSVYLIFTIYETVCLIKHFLKLK